MEETWVLAQKAGIRKYELQQRSRGKAITAYFMAYSACIILCFISPFSFLSPEPLMDVLTLKSMFSFSLIIVISLCISVCVCVRVCMFISK